MPELPAHLREHLEDLRNAFEKNPQTAVTLGLDIVMRHFQDLGAEDRLLKPFLKLRGALADAAIGIHNPLLTVVPRPRTEKGTVTGIEEAVEWANAAAAVQFFLDAGMGRKEATKEVEKRTNKKFDAGALLHYRTRLTRGEGKAREEAKSMYSWILAEWRKQVDLTPRQRAEGVLSVLNNMR
jgi:hypothetical protein